MPRLGHKKSRNGCRQCKARHVKCDEAKPCSNCARHGALCSLIDPNAAPVVPVQVKRESSAASTSRLKKIDTEPARKPSHDQSTSTPATQLPIDYVLNPSPAATTGTSESNSPQSDPYPYLSKFVNRSDVVQPNYWVRDLELMHHWITEAHLTISPREDVQYMWRITAPKQAISQHFLMHELLAYSALHMAFQQIDQQRQYCGLGIHHQDLAIRSMRKVLPNMNADNAGALAVTSALLTLSVFASRGIDAQASSNMGKVPAPVIEDLCDIFYLCQGIGSILFTGAAHILQGPFASLLSRPHDDLPNPPFFDKIVAHIPSVTAALESHEIPADALEVLTTVLGGIRDMLTFSMAPTADAKELRFIFASALKFPPPFLEMLRNRESPALAVMGIYAVGLREAEPSHWFMNGWAERLMRTIGEAIEPSWQPAIQWPWDYVITSPSSGQSTQVHSTSELPSHVLQEQPLD